MSSLHEKTFFFTQRRIQLSDEIMRVLIVDDNDDAGQALLAYLLLEGINCRLAIGGSLGVDVAISWQPHVIVMDVSMPEVSGIKAAQMLRDHDQMKHVGIIAFTALDVQEVRRLMGDQDFDAYCQKGSAPSNLIALIDHFATQ